MYWRTGKTRGSITVFLSMILLVILSVIAACLENARVQTASLQMERCLKGSMDAVLTEYYKPLYDEYRLFFMDKGVESDTLEYRKLEKQLKKYMETALAKSSENQSVLEKGIDLYRMGMDSVQVDSAIRATDYKGNPVTDQVLQYMKYEVSAEGIKSALSHLGIVEDSKGIAKAMEEETEVEEAFSKSGKLMTKLMEQVDGISCGKNGLVFTSNGKIKIKDNFAKRICIENPTKKTVGITSEKVWQSTNGHYINATAVLKDIEDILSKVLKQEKQLEEKQKRQEEKSQQKQTEEVEKDPQKAEKEKRKEEEQKKKEEQKAKEEQLAREGQIKKVNQEQKKLKKQVSGTIKKIKESLNTIAKLEKEIPEVTAKVNRYDKKLSGQKDSVSKEQYKTLKKSAADLKGDIKKIQQAVSMKEQLQKNKSILETLNKELEKNVGSTLEAYEKKRDAIRMRLEDLKGYSIQSLCFSYGKISDADAKDPMDILGGMQDAVLSVTLPQGKEVSKKSISNPDYYFKRYKGKIKAVGNIETGKYAANGDKKKLFGSLTDMFADKNGVSDLGKDASNTLLYQAYIKEYFQSFVSEEERFEKIPLDYEQEYILCGQATDQKNLSQVIDRILLLRTVINFSYLLTDSKGMNMAYATAAALVGFTGLEPLIRATQFSILAVWAYEESLVDVAALMQGKKIPFYKTKKTFILPYSAIFTISKATIQNYAKKLGKKVAGVSIGYEDYLNLFLLFEKQTQKTYRTMDMIEENIKLRHSKLFSFEKCIYSIKVKESYQVPAKFAALAICKDWGYADGTWKFIQEQSYSY